MCFHPDKCNVLSATQKQKPFQFVYKLHGHSREKTKTLQSTMVSPDSQILNGTAILTILPQKPKSQRRNLKVNSQKIKEHAYKALVRPKLEYSLFVWDPSQSNQINQIEKVQRRTARFTCNHYIYYNISSVTNMLEDLDWPLLQVRRLRTRRIMFYKIIHSQVAIYPTDLLCPSDTRTRHYNHNCYKHIQTSKDIYRYSFYPRTIYSGTSCLYILSLLIQLRASRA